MADLGPAISIRWAPRQPERDRRAPGCSGPSSRAMAMTSNLFGIPMVVLGIETTCDETAAAVVERHERGPGKILSNIVLSQISEHAAFGGVVPEIAARAHVEALDLIIAEAMSEAGRSFEQLDGVAAAAGPGLI